MNRWTDSGLPMGLIGFSGLCVVLLFLFSIPAQSEELRKFRLPSEKAPPLIQKFREPPVYRRFREDIRGWTQEKKNKMISSLKTKVSQATQSRKFSKAQHYLKLIQILQER